MTKPLDPNDVTGNSLVPADQEKLPAVKKPVNRFRKIKQLAALADEILEEYDERNKMERDLRKRPPGDPLPSIDSINNMNDYWQHQIAEARELIKLLDNDDQYEETEDDGRHVKSSIVAKRLGLLIGAKHIGQPTTPQAYTMMLLQHVNDSNHMCYLSLETACRELEAEVKFLPDISEVLKKIDEHFWLWRKRESAIYGFESETNLLIAAIEKLKPKAALEIAEKAEQQAHFAFRNKLSFHDRAKAEAIAKQEAAAKAHEAVEIAIYGAGGVRVAAKAVAEAVEKLAIAVSAREAAEATINNKIAESEVAR
jgi:hypothetical protein